MLFAPLSRFSYRNFRKGLCIPWLLLTATLYGVIKNFNQRKKIGYEKHLFAVLAIFLLINIAFAGSLNIDRVWVDGDYGYALVSYVNDSTSTFDKAVTIKCIALDPKGNKININRRSFFAYEYGPIKPGFEGTLKIPVELHGVSMKSMSCSCNER